MKIIITERQYKILESQQDDERVAKKIIYSIWQDELDTTGEIDFYPNVVDYINYKPQGRLEIYKMYRDFLGGWDEMIEKSYELMDRVFDTMDYDFRGGYDFRFKPQLDNSYEEDNTFFVNCPVESDGKVTLMTNGETLLLKDIEEDEDLWWEIESEIRGVIDDILYIEVTKKTGIMVDVNMCWIKE